MQTVRRLRNPFPHTSSNDPPNQPEVSPLDTGTGLGTSLTKIKFEFCGGAFCSILILTIMTPKTHEFIGFEESHLPNKKYNAILKNKTSGRLVRVPFGARGYE